MKSLLERKDFRGIERERLVRDGIERGRRMLRRRWKKMIVERKGGEKTIK